MKIVSLVAENVKKLVAVEIKPDGNLVELTGKNGAGKTSILDSIWWALAGASHIQAAPIRRGQKEARIRLDLGEVVVTRTFARKDEGGFTTGVSVQSQEGARFPSPQKMLDSLLGSLSFDPLAFSRMESREQFDALKRFVPEVDFQRIEGLNKRDFDNRTDLNRKAKEARGAAASIVVSDGLPDEPVNVRGLADELAQAGERNAQIEAAKTSRERAVESIAGKTAKATGEREQAAVLRRQAERLIAEAVGKEEAAEKIERDAADLKAKLDALPPLATPIDTRTIRAKIADAETVNAGVSQRERKKEHLDRAAKLEVEAKAITTQIDARNAEKEQKIASAKLPISGLGFGEGNVLLNGLPFEQASDAEQLRASIAIAMAGNPKLRVIRVRDGSLLDADGMRLLGEMAETNDMQVWVERVATDSAVGIVISDGMVVTPGKSNAEEPAAAGGVA